MRNKTIDDCLDALDQAQNDISRLRRENESLTQSYKEHVAELDRLRQQLAQRGEPLHDAVDAFDGIASDLESISGKPQHLDPRVSTVRRALVNPPTQSAVPKGLIAALQNQRQCDEDGVNCIISRQAVDEAIRLLSVTPVVTQGVMPEGWRFDLKLACQLYNAGYEAGHHDTVEGIFTPIHYSDKDSYHDELVQEWLDEHAAQRGGE